MHFKTANEF